MSEITGEPQLEKPAKKQQELIDIVKMVISAPSEDEITCGECYDVIDQYVDMLRAGQDPETVLPKVKEHLGQCHCCDMEFRALISILEAATSKSEEDSSP
jgi:hypothetical protein